MIRTPKKVKEGREEKTHNELNKDGRQGKDRAFTHSFEFSARLALIHIVYA